MTSQHTISKEIPSPRLAQQENKTLSTSSTGRFQRHTESPPPTINNSILLIEIENREETKSSL